MSKIFYGIPTYKSYDHAYNGVLAALQSTMPPDEIAIIDNSGNGQGTEYLQPLVNKFNNVVIWTQTHNLGVAKSWNTFLDHYNDYLIIANDDVAVEPYTIERMITAAQNNPKDILFAGDGSSGNAFSLFLLTQRGFNTIGSFDEAFYPAYYEDNDYARRMQLKGFKIHFVSGATYRHVGSSTIKRYNQQEMDMHHNAFRANIALYMRKWGGMPHEETYDTAFNM